MYYFTALYQLQRKLEATVVTEDDWKELWEEAMDVKERTASLTGLRNIPL